METLLQVYNCFNRVHVKNMKLKLTAVLVWCLLGGCLVLVWCLFGACLVLVWCLSGACLVVVWWLFGGCLVVVWCLFGTCLVVVWCLLGGCSLGRNLFTIPVLGYFHDNFSSPTCWFRAQSQLGQQSKIASEKA